MDPRQLTEALIEDAMCENEPTHYRDFDDFALDCHSVSLALIRSGLLGEGGPSLRVARGACIGVPGQHSWVVIGNPYDPQSTIVDLTLWSYDRSQRRVWVGDGMDALHRPKSGFHIFQGRPPAPQGGDSLSLDPQGLSEQATRFLKVLGPLDVRGWQDLWSNCGMLGWPAAEILEAFLTQHSGMAPLVPIDVVGMVTDRNPENLYW